MKLTSIYKKVAEDFNLNSQEVEKLYKELCKFIKEKIEDLPLKETLTEEDFNKLKTSFNIPSLGKLYCDYFTYNLNRNRHAKNKENKTTT